MGPFKAAVLKRTLALGGSGAIMLVTISGLGMAGCEEKASDPPAQAAPAPTTAPATGQLDNVVAVSEIETIDALSKLGRLLDAQTQKTRGKSIVVHYSVSQRQMQLADGTNYPLSAEEWKGIVTSGRDGVTVAASLPETAYAHNDGLGRLMRNGWKCTVQDELTILCELVRPTTGFSK